MTDEIGLRLVMWLILFTGSLVLVLGSLYVSLWAAGRITKLLGFWTDFMRVTVMYYQQKRNKKGASDDTSR